MSAAVDMINYSEPVYETPRAKKKDLSSRNVLGFDRIDFYATITIIVTWKQTRGQRINMPGDKVDR